MTRSGVIKFLRGYFWFIVPVSLLGYISTFQKEDWRWTLIDFIISAPAYLCYVFFVRKKKVGPALFWKTCFVLAVAWSIVYNVFIPHSIEEYGLPAGWIIPLNLIGLLLLGPMFLTLYLYAFTPNTTLFDQKDAKAAVANTVQLAPRWKSKKVGLYLLTIPILVLVLVSMLWTIMSFIINSFFSTSGLSATVLKIINISLGFVAAVGAFACVVCIPIGIIYLLRKDNDESVLYDERSGKGAALVVPPEIKGWNWGAAFLGIIWGIYHKVWLSFLVFVPGLNYVWWLVMGLKGNEWAWRKKRWASVSEFKSSQQKWLYAGLILIAIMLAGVISAAFMANNNYK